MRYTLLFFAFLTLLPCAYAQDQLVKLNGDEIPARVLEITLTEVLYQHPDSLQGKTHRIPKADVFMVKFANGTREVFANTQPVAGTKEQAPQDMYLLGRQEAQQYYSGTGALLGSAVTSLFFGYGLIGPLIIGVINPQVHASRTSDPELLNNPEYVRGYKQRARRKKTGKTLLGAGIGTAIGFTAGMIIVAYTWGR